MLNSCVKKDKVSNFFEEKLEIVLNAGYNDLDNEIFFSTDVTQCDRRLLYKISKFYKRDKLLQLHEEFLSKKWESILSKIERINILATNFTVADHNCCLSAIVHLIIEIEHKKILVLIKEVGDDFFNQGKTARRHVVDIISQMWMAEINDGILIYENKETKKFSVLHIVPHDSVLNSINSKLMDLHQKKLLGTMPERKYDSQNSKECTSCEFKKECWKL